MATESYDWSCGICTYRHEGKESAFLTCAVCASNKPRSQGKDKRAKRQVNLLQHFGTSKEQRGIKRRRSTPPVHKKENSPKRSILDALRPCSASSFVPRARYRENPKAPWREIEDDQVEKLCPMTVIRDVLPSAVASKLLEQLEKESATWNRGNWIVHGKEHQIPRTTATYNLTSDSTQKGPLRHGDEPQYGPEDDEEDEYMDQRRSIAPELRQAANCIADLVRRHCPWTVAIENENWEPTFAFANRYNNGQECVGWHADHITNLGPRPIIVGLSLGACRRFDLRQQPSSSKDDSKTIRHVSVPMPHNSVVIMWNEAQESWQHSVPRCSDESMTLHPRVGPVRISLTFRKRRTLPDCGNCHCGRPAGLRAKDGRYFLFCRPYGKEKNKTCVFWKPCSWAEDEAKRLTQLEGAAKQDAKA